MPRIAPVSLLLVSAAVAAVLWLSGCDSVHPAHPQAGAGRSAQPQGTSAAGGRRAGPGLAGSSWVNCAGSSGSRLVSQAALDACGFPSMRSTGPPAGAPLRPSHGFTASTPGKVYDGLDITGGVTIAANDVTIENSEITDENLSGAAIVVASGVSGTMILHDSIHGSDRGGRALASAVWNLYGATLGGLLIDHTNFYNGDRILTGFGTVTDSYCLGGATFGDEHDECVYTSGGPPGISLRHDTLLNANPYQTATVFVDSPDGSGSNGQGVVEIEDSLLGGGDYCIYGGEGRAGTHHRGPERVVGNRFAALYFPGCGQFGVAAYMPADLVWTGNVWDATGRPAPTPQGLGNANASGERNRRSSGVR